MFKRLGNLIRGFFGLFVGGLEKRNPEALLEVEKENLREQIAKFNTGLSAHAGLCERLMTEVGKLEKQHDEYRAKTAANLKADNRKLAGQYALRLKKVAAGLEDNREQLEEAEKTYRDLVNARDVSIKGARDKIESLRRGIDEMKVQKAMAELNEMASGMINEIGGSGDTLNRLHEMVEEERTKAAGRARVARDTIDTTEIEMEQSARDAMEELALADFAAAEGLDVGKAPASSTAGESGGDGSPGSEKKSMGPEEESA